MNTRRPTKSHPVFHVVTAISALVSLSVLFQHYTAPGLVSIRWPAATANFTAFSQVLPNSSWSISTIPLPVQQSLMVLHSSTTGLRFGAIILLTPIAGCGHPQLPISYRKDGKTDNRPASLAGTLTITRSLAVRPRTSPSPLRTPMTGDPAND